MTDRPDIDPKDEDDLLAAEYVLGVLDAEAAKSAAARARRDPAFAAAVSRWTTRLEPLNAAYATVPPPAHSFAEVEARLFPEAAREGFARRVWASVGLWRGAALAASLALAMVVISDRSISPPPPSLISAITAPDGSLAFVARLDPATGTLTIRQSGGATAPADQSYEAWVIPADGTPRSLGLVGAPGSANHDLIAPGVTLAISLEPSGGSTTGAPTGPVVAIGTAIEL